MIHLFWLGFALAASPGPDFFLILRHTLTYGRLIGYATLIGNRVSLSVHISLAILGLSIVLQRSMTLFLIVRFLGAPLI
jgi:threonine/homoserine/homoserine lactone efflux protein